MGKYDYLMHFNPFHDPKNGQFTSGGAGLSVIFGRNKASANNKSTPPKGTQEYDDAKQRALKEGTATDVLQFRGDLSINELQNALSRINLERSLASISDQELAVGKGATERFFDTVGKGINYLNTAQKLIDTTNRLANSMSKKSESLSQKLAKEYLDAESNSDKIDIKTLNRSLDYLDKIARMEKHAK